MLKRSAAMAAKDLKLSVSGGQGLVQAVLLGLLLIFLFSLSKPVGGVISAQAAGAIFWLASAFGLVLVFNDLFAIEEANGARVGILSSPAPVHAVWIGKGVAGLCLLLVSQLVFLPATVAFLGQAIHGPWWLLGVTLVGADIGLVIIGALLGALSQGQAARESLLSVIVFPLLLPVLLSGITLFAMCFSPDPVGEPGSWLGLILAFDALFAGAGLFLFPFVYSGEE
ncbi:MAG: heme exporter protein CcmB [Pseudodesulfovibrio sp.]|uniref:Cytochrome c-type biogenesis protein CcmB n=1 Tax=Pseudodesulfovibrio aespoeensis (strain ATCC 700646 / DSM 10631 / Aspo-2) TaxID=643562 RepID=E6VUW2_PSEA9|nr:MULTISPECIES: heme exporter protein CcmB [Pseudodesulfovibrio]MBU4191115.1 heme exporter protein CcmB [Pseudomonadota bacterium]ADU63470.1 cytochrome c-type biogenesis protein CcmB [Pseudodesulfovibrio aespoeensis Aspo-2]MBU4243079.1 heme exporter protein CcmB [Pseudomonadota bacterium]MBU4378429.1 heme exporter protein CcmB [Pseudomonadota bacterium]MBU4474415.1 heme exporter protein CcmB [Pseudomonadota bacterium]